MSWSTATPAVVRFGWTSITCSDISVVFDVEIDGEGD